VWRACAGGSPQALRSRPGVRRQSAAATALWLRGAMGESSRQLLRISQSGVALRLPPHSMERQHGRPPPHPSPLPRWGRGGRNAVRVREARALPSPSPPWGEGRDEGVARCRELRPLSAPVPWRCVMRATTSKETARNSNRCSRQPAEAFARIGRPSMRDPRRASKLHNCEQGRSACSEFLDFCLVPDARAF
jgi:hypothetical protein